MKNKSMRILLACAVTVLGLSGCGSSDDPAEVAIAELANTGTDGYKINVTIDGTVSGDLYVCTDGFRDIDYVMYDASTQYTPWLDEPEDWGDVIVDTPWLILDGDMDVAEIDTDGPTPGYLVEGQTYDLYEGGGAAALLVNTIDTFDCSTIVTPG